MAKHKTAPNNTWGGLTKAEKKRANRVIKEAEERMRKRVRITKAGGVKNEANRCYVSGV